MHACTQCTMANRDITTINNVTVVVVALVLSSLILSSDADWKDIAFPEVEVTLSNDGLYPVWYMCQMTTDRSNSLYELAPNGTYRFSFSHVAFPMRWCYLYINQRSQGFFWAYSVRSRCTKCFWSINKHPSLYRNDKGRWERQKLFMAPRFNISEYLMIDRPDS